MNNFNYYVLDIDKLEKGDVICTTSKKSFISGAIRIGTKSNYSHVLMVYGYGAFIHADSMGVYSHNIQRLIFRSVDSVKVLRLKQEYQTIIPKLCEYLKSEVGKVYGTISALNAWLKMDFISRFENPSDIQFCSKLIAECFERCNLKIVDNPKECFPKHIAESELFLEVLNVLKKCNNKEIDFIKNTKNPQVLQAEIFTQILTKIKDKTNVNILTFSEAEIFILNNPEFDLAFKEIYENNGYKDIHKIELQRNGYRYSTYEIFKKHIDMSTEPSRQLDFLQKMADGLITERFNQVNQYVSIQNEFINKNNRPSVFYEYLISFYSDMLKCQEKLRQNILEYKKQA